MDVQTERGSGGRCAVSGTGETVKHNQEVQSEQQISEAEGL